MQRRGNGGRDGRAQELVEVARDEREEQLLAGQAVLRRWPLGSVTRAAQRPRRSRATSRARSSTIAGEAGAGGAADGLEHARHRGEDVAVERVPARDVEHRVEQHPLDVSRVAAA